MSTKDGSAIEPDDYQQNTITLTFIPGGPNEIDVPIQIFEDSLIENTETLSVELTTTDQDIVFPNGKTASITIDDDDGTLFIYYQYQYHLVPTRITIPSSNVILSLRDFIFVS